jgi:hypothetical protein
MRPFVSALTIAALLLCPYECAVKSAQAQSRTSVPQPACCSQCQARQAKESPPARPLPAPSEDGRSCVCEGAVFASQPGFQLEVYLLVLPWMGTCDAALALAHAPAVADCPREDWPQSSGSQLRLAMGSLLL